MTTNNKTEVRKRLLAKVVVNDAGCWVWSGTIDGQKGYGRVRYGGKSHLAHRLIYMLHKGEIPAGLTLDHLCRNRACVNPDHLEPVSIKENVLRGEGLTAVNARKTHCYKGHEFNEENTGPLVNGGRYCRACNRERFHREKAERRQKESQIGNC